VQDAIVAAGIDQPGAGLEIRPQWRAGVERPRGRAHRRSERRAWLARERVAAHEVDGQLVDRDHGPRQHAAQVPAGGIPREGERPGENAVVREPCRPEVEVVAADRGQRHPGVHAAAVRRDELDREPGPRARALQLALPVAGERGPLRLGRLRACECRQQRNGQQEHAPKGDASKGRPANRHPGIVPRLRHARHRRVPTDAPTRHTQQIPQLSAADGTC